MPAASGLQRIPGRAISVKLHPQEVLAAKLCTEYACSKRSEIDSTTSAPISGEVVAAARSYTADCVDLANSKWEVLCTCGFLIELWSIV